MILIKFKDTSTDLPEFVNNIESSQSITNKDFWLKEVISSFFLLSFFDFSYINMFSDKTNSNNSSKNNFHQKYSGRWTWDGIQMSHTIYLKWLFFNNGTDVDCFFSKRKICRKYLFHNLQCCWYKIDKREIYLLDTLKTRKRITQIRWDDQ